MKPVEEILWRSWESGLFEFARREGRPVLLYLSASWCHWCHVMEADTLTHPEVVRLIEAHYIPVRVDTDKRPDLNLRYNMGGWPSVAVLNPQGDVLAGETYLPPGPMIQMLQQFRKATGEGGPAASRISGKKSASGRPASAAEEEVRRIGREAIHRTADWIKRTFDPNFGGFMGPMKFPMPSVLELTRTLIRLEGNDPWRPILVDTLDAMRDGEIRDMVDGGFFRYSVMSDWSRPHYEKMLESQAQLLVTYLAAYRLTGDVRYRITAEEILRYVRSELWMTDAGWFAGSQTADQDYYESPEDDRMNTDSPAVDPTLYVDWNASMARALIKAAVSLGNGEYGESAAGLLDLITARCVTEDSGVRHFYSPGAGTSSEGYLGDQVSLLQALLDAYEYSADEKYLERSRGIVEAAIRDFWDPEATRFRDRRFHENEPEGLRASIHPLAENSEMAVALIRSATLLRTEEYRTRAGTVLAALADQYNPYRLYAAPYALAMERYLRPELKVCLVASDGDPARRALTDAAMGSGDSGWVIEHLDPERDSHRIEARRLGRGGRAAAYVCADRTCHPPTAEPDELVRTMGSVSAEGVGNE